MNDESWGHIEKKECQSSKRQPKSSGRKQTDQEVILGESLVLSPILVTHKPDPYADERLQLLPRGSEEFKAPFSYKDIEFESKSPIIKAENIQ